MERERPTVTGDSTSALLRGEKGNGRTKSRAPQDVIEHIPTLAQGGVASSTPQHLCRYLPTINFQIRVAA